MAGQITHMEIAYKLIDRLGIDEGKEEFILGSVAPDSVHFDEDYLSKKVHSHLFENCGPWGDTQNYDNWILNIKAFWYRYVVTEEDQNQKAFYTGVVVHCLTDYWNDLSIWRTLQKKMMPPLSLEEFKEGYSPEYMRIDRWLYQNIDDADEIMELLENSHEEDCEDYVKATCIARMKRHLIDVQYNLPDPIDVSGHKFYTADLMRQFVSEVPDRVYQQIKEFGNTPVKQMRLINDDFVGHIDRLRHACRGILVQDGKVLLCHEPGSGLYIIPGGGVEGHENYADCCEREMLEETGYKTKAVKEYLDIEELFDVWRHINHYYICEIVEDTGVQHLTEAEKLAGYTNAWVPIGEALDIFGKYEDYHYKDIAVYGLYKREYAALKEYKSAITF
ncbi:ADP-ribose pyrophosphatase YjhB, NUDIX family [Butyrivibrio fibrisolvens]|uniref:ADP-ribose pyrophosphatase YjhB, NUDIX family n=1 Tax=Butyrivibrio fibrisolvens TaxID=831 RepID=A0A1H9UZ68_BUTFI|nr:NUDIX domain-containing protein [Butyrivibrio fibrisolvens]SES14775.1 ADP-ribose pyrophosphatase YjhB, NUDIX family [Butyrivibrio fibrisolvens]